VLLLVSTLLIGVLLGIGLGGDPRNLAEVRIRGWWLIPLALLLQLIPIPDASEGVGRYLPLFATLVSYVGLLAVAGVNWRLRGFLLILLGLTLNFTVIAANQGMPVAEAALRRAGDPALFRDLPTDRVGKHHLADERDVLLPLADVIAFGEPFALVVSAGDLVIDTGGSIFLAAAILGRPERAAERRPRPATVPQAEMWGTRR
jgi:hypothetical protein